jgi:sugar lactone lactonase YvrE
MSSGNFTYQPIADWAKWPADWNVHEVTAVATDSQDRVFVFVRGDHPVAVFDPQGNLLHSWGEGKFNRPHGITIGPDDSVYLTDDLDHTVHKYTPDGRLLFTLGQSGKPSDTGATSIDFRTIKYAGPPFHFPTNLAIAANGDLFISDGYGNARIHRYSPDGQLKRSWGEPGPRLGQFQVPHGIAISPDQILFVADRENSRLQLFSLEGQYIDQWTDVVRPCEVAFDVAGRVYVAELGYRTGMWPGTTAPSPDAPGGRLSIFDPSGELLARFGGGEHPCEPGDFFAPHDIWIDSQQNLYVAEVVRSCCGNKRPPVGDYHTLQKLVRVQGASR